MPMLQVRWVVEGKPDFVVGVFPDQGLEREIDGSGRGCLHQRGAAFGIAEDQQPSRSHLQSDFGCFAAVIDNSEDGDALLGKQ